MYLIITLQVRNALVAICWCGELAHTAQPVHLVTRCQQSASLSIIIPSLCRFPSSSYYTTKTRSVTVFYSLVMFLAPTYIIFILGNLAQIRDSSIAQKFMPDLQS